MGLWGGRSLWLQDLQMGLRGQERLIELMATRSSDGA